MRSDSTLLFLENYLGFMPDRSSVVTAYLVRMLLKSIEQGC